MEATGPQIDRLIEEHLSYAEALGRALWSRLPFRPELDEVLSLARLGLVEAARKFDPGRGVSFKTFSYYRVRGAIFDGLRASGPLSREQHARYRFERGMDLFRLQQAEANPRSGAGPANLDGLRELMVVMTSVYLLSIDDPDNGGDLPDRNTASPMDHVERREATVLIRRLLDKLNDTERAIIRMYYFEDRTLEEIGRVLGLSRSWACRMHARILKKMYGLHTKSGLTGKRMLRA